MRNEGKHLKNVGFENVNRWLVEVITTMRSGDGIRIFIKPWNFLFMCFCVISTIFWEVHVWNSYDFFKGTRKNEGEKTSIVSAVKFEDPLRRCARLLLYFLVRGHAFNGWHLQAYSLTGAAKCLEITSGEAQSCWPKNQ